MIFRSFTTREPEPLITLLKTLILSKLDYGSVLWAPAKISDMRRIEQVLSKFTKRIDLYVSQFSVLTQAVRSCTNIQYDKFVRIFYVINL